MRKILSSRLTTIAAAAAIVALSGGTGAYAATQINGDSIQNNTVDSTEVQNGSLTGADVDNGSLTGADLADGSVKTADLGLSAVTSTKISDGTIQPADISTTAKQQIVDMFQGQKPQIVDASVSQGLLIFPALSGSPSYLLVANFSVQSDVPVKFTADDASCVAAPFDGVASCSVTDQITDSAGTAVTFQREGEGVTGASASTVAVTVVKVG